MGKIKKGDVAIIEYKAVIIDSGIGEMAKDEGRMRLRAGDLGAIGGIDKEILGMAIGEHKMLEIPPEKTFGPRDPDLVMTLPRNNFHKYPDLKAGSLVKLFSKSGEEIEVVTREVNEETVTVDANHPLAGMSLSFDMTVLDVEVA